MMNTLPDLNPDFSELPLESAEVLKPEYPMIPGLTDGIPPQVLAAAWQRAIAQLERRPYDPFALMDERFFPYAMPLLEHIGAADPQEYFQQNAAKIMQLSLEQVKEHFPPAKLGFFDNYNLYLFWLRRLSTVLDPRALGNIYADKTLIFEEDLPITIKFYGQLAGHKKNGSGFINFDHLLSGTADYFQKMLTQFMDPGLREVQTPGILAALSSELFANPPRTILFGLTTPEHLYTSLLFKALYREVFMVEEKVEREDFGAENSSFQPAPRSKVNKNVFSRKHDLRQEAISEYLLENLETADLTKLAGQFQEEGITAKNLEDLKTAISIYRSQKKLSGVFDQFYRLIALETDTNSISEQLRSPQQNYTFDSAYQRNKTVFPDLPAEQTFGLLLYHAQGILLGPKGPKEVRKYFLSIIQEAAKDRTGKNWCKLLNVFTHPSARVMINSLLEESPLLLKQLTSYAADCPFPPSQTLLLQVITNFLLAKTKGNATLDQFNLKFLANELFGSTEDLRQKSRADAFAVIYSLILNLSSEMAGEKVANSKVTSEQLLLYFLRQVLSNQAILRDFALKFPLIRPDQFLDYFSSGEFPVFNSVSRDLLAQYITDMYTVDRKINGQIKKYLRSYQLPEDFDVELARQQNQAFQWEETNRIFRTVALPSELSSHGNPLFLLASFGQVEEQAPGEENLYIKLFSVAHPTVKGLQYQALYSVEISPHGFILNVVGELDQLGQLKVAGGVDQEMAEKVREILLFSFNRSVHYTTGLKSETKLSPYAIKSRPAVFEGGQEVERGSFHEHPDISVSVSPVAVAEAIRTEAATTLKKNGSAGLYQKSAAEKTPAPASAATNIPATAESEDLWQQPRYSAQTAKRIEAGSAEHKEALKAIIKLVEAFDIQHSESPDLYDLFTFKGEQAIVWEIKSINTSEKNNERDQIRAAIAQLVEYQFVLQEDHADSEIKNFAKAILLSKKPTSLESEKFLRYLDFLEKEHGLLFFWMENENIQGTPSSIEQLGRFLV